MSPESQSRRSHARTTTSPRYLKTERGEGGGGGFNVENGHVSEKNHNIMVTNSLLIYLKEEKINFGQAITNIEREEKERKKLFKETKTKGTL